jgi:tetratricopeptide (TPR) repeat protein
VLSLRSSAWVQAVVLAQVLLAAGLARGAEAPAPPPASPADAGRGADGVVAEHVALGHHLYQRGQYQEAIVEFRRAYELRADPHFLYEIAEAYRQLGASDQALFYYDRYLVGAPGAPDRDAVEDRVLELESLRARPPAPALGATLSPGARSAAVPKSRPSSTWRKWWFWTAVGVAIAAGVTAAALSSRSDSSVPATDLGDKRFFP